MPLHNWSRMPAGLFHDFHQTWSIYIRTALNGGILPKGISALVEQRTGPKEPDVIAVESTYRTTKEIYARRANRIVIKRHLGQTVAAIEIVSPGNKDSPASIRDLVNKTIDLLRTGIHVLLIDVFPPTARDPLGLHKLIWDEITSDPFEFPAGKDRILASYETGAETVAYVDPVAVGDILPDMPLFLADGWHVKTPLEATYQSAWTTCPEEIRTAVETGVLPEAT